jgi:hypothetical protein
VKLFSRHNLEDVAEGEPVFLIRASDAEGPNLLRKYAFLLRARHPRAHLLADEVEAFADELFEWQHADGNAAPPPVDPEPDVVDVEGRLAGHVEDGFEGARELEEEELLEARSTELES